MDGLTIDWIGGNCPVQAEGEIDGQPFYFRARGMRWVFSVEGQEGEVLWSYDERFGDTEFAAGWMTEDEARAAIEKSAEKYFARCAPDEKDDGQPDEQQEWRDFDPDC